MDSARIVTVTLNAAEDVTYLVPEIQLGDTNRITKVHSQAGGKGINVARTIHRLGGDVIATGFVAGRTGQTIRNRLQSEGIPEALYVVSTGESRKCIAVVEEGSGQVTEFLEPGPQLSESDIDDFGPTLRNLISKNTIVVFSGSLPPGVDSRVFQRLVRQSTEAGARIVVDTSGAALIDSAAERPLVMKPNHAEAIFLSERYGIDASHLSSEEWARQVLNRLHSEGVVYPILTMGRQGAYAWIDHQLIHTPSISVPVVNPVGSGDAFLGGLLWALSTNVSMERALQIASASAGCNAKALYAGDITYAEVLSLADRILIQQLS